MNTAKTVLLMAVLTVLLVLVGNLIGGRGGMMIAFLFAIVMNFGSYWFIVNPLSGSGLANLFSTHPPMEERIARLERMVYGQGASR